MKDFTLYMLLGAVMFVFAIVAYCVNSTEGFWFFLIVGCVFEVYGIYKRLKK